jgi:hypothetical protein
MLRFGAMKLLTNARSFGRGGACGITVQASVAVFIIQRIVLTSPEFSWVPGFFKRSPRRAVFIGRIVLAAFLCSRLPPNR